MRTKIPRAQKETNDFTGFFAHLGPVGSFSLVTCMLKKLPKWCLYEKFVRKMWLKLTPACVKAFRKILVKLAPNCNICHLWTSNNSFFTIRLSHYVVWLSFQMHFYTTRFGSNTFWDVFVVLSNLNSFFLVRPVLEWQSKLAHALETHLSLSLFIVSPLSVCLCVRESVCVCVWERERQCVRFCVPEKILSKKILTGTRTKEILRGSS